MMSDDKSTDLNEKNALILPVLPLRDVVVYPHMVIPLFVGREKSIRALERSIVENNKQILLVSQKKATEDEPEISDIYRVGTISSLLQLLKLPDGTIKVLVEGGQRAKIINFLSLNDLFAAQIIPLTSTENADEREIEGLLRSITSRFDQYIKLNKKIPPEILNSLSSIDEPGRFADTIAAHMAIKIEDKQKILEIVNVQKRLEHLMAIMESEIDLLQVEKRIRKRVKGQMEKTQREYYLNEQMKAIQKELGELENVPNELDELARKIEEVGLSKEAFAKATTEFNKLKTMSPCRLKPPWYVIMLMRL